MVVWWRYSVSSIMHVNTHHDPESNIELPERNETYPTLKPRGWVGGRGKQARAIELIAEGDGYTFIAAPRSPDLRHTSKRRRHLCFCGNE